MIALADLKKYVNVILIAILLSIVFQGAYDAFFYAMKGDNFDAIRSLAAMAVVVILIIAIVLILFALMKFGLFSSKKEATLPKNDQTETEKKLALNPFKISKEHASVLLVVITLLVALVSGIGTSVFVYSIYQAPQLSKYQEQLNLMNDTLSVQHQQIGIMNESLIKRVQLALEVVPRYDWELFTSGNGSVQLTNTTLTIPRTATINFTIYVSNVGNAMAHLLYWTVTIWTPHETEEGPMNDIQNVVLAPYSMYNMTYALNPSALGTTDNEAVLTFALMSTESIVYESVNATFR